MSQRCEVCQVQDARYVCSHCGRRVCAQDFQPRLWLCTNCQPITRAEGLQAESKFPIGVSWILFVSFAMILIGMILMAVASFTQGQGTTSGGVVILIGPIPIILGSGPASNWLILLGAVVTVIALLVLLFARRRM